MYMFSNSVCGNFSWQFCFYLFVFCWFPVDKIRRQNCSKHTSWSLSVSFSHISPISLTRTTLEVHFELFSYSTQCSIITAYRYSPLLLLALHWRRYTTSDDYYYQHHTCKKSEILGHWPKFHFSFLFIATRWEWNWICMCMYMCVSMFVLQVILIEHIIVYISYSTPIAIIASTNKI